MWELDYKESWALKNWCFWTVVLEKTLQSPLDCKEIQPVHPKEINLEYPLQRLMLKLKLQYFGHLMRRTDSFVKTLMLERLKAEGEGGNGGFDGWMASPTQRTWVWVNLRTWWWQGGLACWSPWSCIEFDTTEWLNWSKLPSCVSVWIREKRKETH